MLGCKLFIKEISPKARDQLLGTNQVLAEGDFISKLNNTNCNDLMSLKEAKKIMDSSKEKLQITIARDYVGASNSSHQAQSSISTTGAVNNFYKGLLAHRNQLAVVNSFEFVRKQVTISSRPGKVTRIRTCTCSRPRGTRT